VVDFIRNIQNFLSNYCRVLPLEKKNIRDWSKYDENVVTRYKPMFPLYVFEH